MMDAHFALFNSHVNDAREKAKQVFIEMYGKGTWDEKMQPIIDEGIMSVLPYMSGLFSCSSTMRNSRPRKSKQSRT